MDDDDIVHMMTVVFSDNVILLVAHVNQRDQA